MADRAWPQAALLLAGHGLAARPEGALPTLRHAETLRARGLFADVRAGFLRQEPELAATLAELTQPRVYVVPMLASRGYIADTVMAGRLNLSGPVTRRRGTGGEQELCFCDPIGLHPRIPALLVERIAALCRRHGLAPATTEVILVGHGTPRQPNSSDRAREVAAMIAASGIASRVQAMFLDEEPRIEHWKAQTRAENVVVAPFLIANWYHGSEDLPGRLGIEPGAPGGASSLIGGQRLWSMGPLGEAAEIADLALAMVGKFDGQRAK